MWVTHFKSWSSRALKYGVQHRIRSSECIWGNLVTLLLVLIHVTQPIFHAQSPVHCCSISREDINNLWPSLSAYMDEGILHVFCVSHIARSEHRPNPLLELTCINVLSRPITELSLITHKTNGLNSKCTLQIPVCSWDSQTPCYMCLQPVCRWRYSAGRCTQVTLNCHYLPLFIQGRVTESNALFFQEHPVHTHTAES